MNQKIISLVFPSVKASTVKIFCGNDNFEDKLDFELNPYKNVKILGYYTIFDEIQQ